MIFDALADKTVGIWGAGVEGRACLRALPTTTVPILITDDIEDAAAIELAASVGIQHSGVDQIGQLGLDVLVRSAGIPVARPEIAQLRQTGTRVTTLLDLFMHRRIARSPAPTIAVTGTKGKSTTTILVRDLLVAAGTRAELAGNIGVPVTEIADDAVAVIEVSSYQAADVTSSPTIGVLTNLDADHLSWHGSLDQYRADKLNLFRHDGLKALIVGDADEQLRQSLSTIDTELVFAADGPIGLADGCLVRGDAVLAGLTGTALEPRHLGRNLITALTAVELVLGRAVSPVAIDEVVQRFERPPGRLERVPSNDGVEWVNDVLGSNPFAASAGVDTYSERPMIAIIGGDDRGVDPGELLDALGRQRRLRAIIAIGPAGTRWFERLKPLAEDAFLVEGDDVATAVGIARSVAHAGDVVLFSPGAPTTPGVGNWTDRAAIFRLGVTT